MIQEIKEHRDDLPDMITTVLLVMAGVTLGLEGLTLLTGVELNIFRLVFTEAGGIPELEGIFYLIFATAAVYQLIRGYSLFQDR